MLLVHFAPEHALRRIKREGLKPSRYRQRAQGVYALPLLAGVPPTLLRQWRRTLHAGRKWQGKKLTAVVFRIPDDEPVWFFGDWIHNHLGGGPEYRRLATQAAAKVAEMFRRTTLSFDDWVAAEGIKLGSPDTPMGEKNRAKFHEYWSEDRFSLGCNLPELVVPRWILPRDIVRIERIPSSRRERATAGRGRAWEQNLLGE